MPETSESFENGAVAAEPSPADQALQVVDRAVGAVPVVADAVRKTVDQLTKPETLARGTEVRKQVTDQVVEQARKARERVEPTVNRVRERI
jgi:hypothetical protein